MATTITADPDVAGYVLATCSLCAWRGQYLDYAKAEREARDHTTNHRRFKEAAPATDWMPPAEATRARLVAVERIDEAAKIIALAERIAASAPKHQAKYTHKAGVPWGLIHELRRELAVWDGQNPPKRRGS